LNSSSLQKKYKNETTDWLKVGNPQRELPCEMSRESRNWKE